MESEDAMHKSAFMYSQERQIGLKASVGDQYKITMSLWERLTSGRKKRLKFQGKSVDNDAIFGMSYSPHGDALIAACERKSFIAVDPLTEKVITVKDDAHTDCCNNVSFLDDRMFTTCSDDTTIAIWDLRNMSHEVHRLCGHSGWVKNVEIHRESQKIISSGFDENIIAWNLDKTDKNGQVKHRRLLSVQGLLRMRLSLDGASMYISSTDLSAVIAIHNLEPSHLAKDVGFTRKVSDPLDGDGITTIKRKSIYPAEFWRFLPYTGRNHVELYPAEQNVTDDAHSDDDSFPVMCGHSIDVHPRNSALLLHQIGTDEKRTVVHNIKSRFIYSGEDLDDWTPDSDILLRGAETHILPQDYSFHGEYIEEVAFSHCGKLFSSPCGYGVFIAAFDEHFNDYETHMASCLENSLTCKNENPNLEDSPPRTRSKYRQLTPIPAEPHIVKATFGHASPVLCTCFSPTQVQLATGCEGGYILFHNPVL